MGDSLSYLDNLLVYYIDCIWWLPLRRLGEVSSPFFNIRRNYNYSEKTPLPLLRPLERR